MHVPLEIGKPRVRSQANGARGHEAHARNRDNVATRD